MPQAPPASSADSKYETEFKNLTSTSAFNSSSVEDKGESIGDMIYDFIQKEIDEKKASQITGMILRSLDHKSSLIDKVLSITLTDEFICFFVV
jgi:hypothetical protein